MKRRWAVTLFAPVAIVLSTSAGRAANATLIEAAKREGQLTWYTTLRPPLAIAAATAFQAKYGIPVSQATYTGDDVVMRISTEGRSGSPRADIFDSSEGVAALKKENLVLKWQPDLARRLPKQYVDPNGYWVAANVYILSPAFNTNLVPKGSEPKTFEDLLDPKWKGKMVWSSTPTMSGAPGFIGLVLTKYGEQKGTDFLRKLVAQNITPIMGGPAALNQIVTGEYPIDLQAFSRQVAGAAAKGAPVDRIPMNPALGLLAVVALPNNAPHPNAGKLMMDFLLSTEGQKLYAQHGYTTVDPDVQPQDPSLQPDASRTQYFSPDQIADVLPKFAHIYQEIFR